MSEHEPPRSEQQDTRHGRGRRPELVPDYTLLSRQDVVEIATETATEIVRRRTGHLVTKDEVEQIIDRKAVSRLHALGLIVSPVGDAPGAPEANIRRMVEHYMALYQQFLDSKSTPFKTTLVVAQIGTAVIGFSGVIWAIVTFIVRHIHYG